MKLKTIIARALINRFALLFLWFVVEHGQKGYCHGQLNLFTCCGPAFELVTFWTVNASILP
jgi:hypothetical protein